MTAPKDPAPLGVMLNRLEAEAPQAVDLTDVSHEEWVISAAERIQQGAAGSVSALETVDGSLSGGGLPVACGLAVKLALSRARVRAFPEAAHLSVVLAVYRETTRMLPPDTHRHGEDFLRRKLAQLRWLFEGTNHTWDLTVVDDGCPDGSGAKAREILASCGKDTNARVLFLEDAIREGLPVAGGLTSTSDSRKGGAIRYGMWHAAQTPRSNHVILFTDADLSTHLGLSGLLMEPVLLRGAAAAVASRREPTSVVVKARGRDSRGKLFIYLWKRLIAPLRGIVDTQCGFKAFAPEPLEGWFAGALESGFAFDIELLLHIELTRPGSVEKVAVAWIDSEALSTTAELEPYLDMLRMVVRFYRHYLPGHAGAEGFARLVDELDPESFNRLLGNLPAAIERTEPATFEEFDGVSPAELRARAGLPG